MTESTFSRTTLVMIACAVIAFTMVLLAAYTGEHWWAKAAVIPAGVAGGLYLVIVRAL
jgi:hypothetical protein